MTSFEGKVIAITGAASGIGRATAILLASRGAAVSLADIQEERLQQTLTAVSIAEWLISVKAVKLISGLMERSRTSAS